MNFKSVSLAFLFISVSGSTIAMEKELMSVEALLHEIQRGNLQAVRDFITAGGDINQYDKEYRMIPLHKACFWNQLEIAKELIRNGANLNCRELRFGQTPLHHAVSIANPEIIRVLIENGADINFKDFQGRTPLSLAQYMAQRWPASSQCQTVAQIFLEEIECQKEIR
jgi:ankyrin repeat protein